MNGVRRVEVRQQKREAARLTWSGSGALVAAGAEDGGVLGARRDMQELCSENTSTHILEILFEFYYVSVDRLFAAKSVLGWIVI